MKFKIALLACLFIYSCQTGSNGDLKQQITQLEAETKETASKEKSAQLAQLYQDYVKKHPEDSENNARYLHQAANLQNQANKSGDALNLLKQGIGKYYNSAYTDQNIQLLASVLSIHYAPDQRKNMAGELKKLFPDEATMQAKINAQIEAAKIKIYNETTHRIDPDAATVYVGLCELFTSLFPTNDNSPKYLFQAAETARSVKNHTKALQIYDLIFTQYQSYEKAPQALFLKAFTLDNDLKQFDKAKAIYTEFLEKYPDNDFADDTQFLLKNLGKSDDEIIQSFEQ